MTKFTKQMKQTHTILVPTMISPHFEFMVEVIKNQGYKCELLDANLPNIGEEGLKHVHNDMCYPALLVIGQFMKAIISGGYDTKKIALLITQTGGGCRASNYITLLRKALDDSGYGYIPVVSLNFNSLDENGFYLPKICVIELFLAIFYGDLIMNIFNQSVSYEKIAGISKEKFLKCQNFINSLIGKFGFYRLKNNCKKILDEFKQIEKEKIKKIKVGIVGEIYMKYSPIGNGNLSEFLVKKGAEVVNTGLMDFILTCIYDDVFDKKIYGIKSKTEKILHFVALLLQNRQKMIINLMKKAGFNPPTPFSEVIKISPISKGVKMGEGWLLSAEMAEFAKNGVKNILCAQPFGCLPNHIIARGMVRKIKEIYPDTNIISIDYDISASKINQENRINLMLQSAKI